MKASRIWSVIKGTALPICFLLATSALLSQIVSKTGIFRDSPAQVAAEVVRSSSEELILTGVFKIVKITPTGKLTLINTDSNNPSAYEVMCPTGIFYELGDVVNAWVTFEYVSGLYKLVNIVIRG